MTDPYVYENGVLKNKLNIKNHEQLRKAEAGIGFVKLINIDSVNIDFFDENIIKQIHKHILEDIFDWAGEFRTVPIIKEEIVIPGCTIPYSNPPEIKKDLDERLNVINKIAWQNMSSKEIANTFARQIALLWRVHPFRDGNTRTMLAFAYLYAKEHGFPFDIETFTSELNRQYSESGKIIKYSIRDKFVLACLDEENYPEPQYLARVFYTAINNFKEKEEKQTSKK